jgi:hypothetical protein
MAQLHPICSEHLIRTAYYPTGSLLIPQTSQYPQQTATLAMAVQTNTPVSFKFEQVYHYHYYHCYRYHYYAVNV